MYVYMWSSSVQSLNCVRLFATPWSAAHQASLSITDSRSSLKLMSIYSVMPSNHVMFCCPLLLLPSIFSSIRAFSNESVIWIRWPKYWSFSFRISPSNEYSGWFPLGRTGYVSSQSKRLLRIFSNTTVQNHQYFSSQLFLQSSSHNHTWLLEETIALTRRTFVGKEMSLLFHMLPRLVISLDFLPRSKYILISWMQ